MKIKSYKGAGVFLIRYENDRFEVLLGKRSIRQGYGTWSIPGGGMEKRDVSFRDCAFRELREETEIDLQHVQHRVLGRCVKNVPFFHWHTYIVFMWGNEPETVPHEYSQLSWIPLDEVNNHKLFISLGTELRASRKLLKKHELLIAKLAGLPFEDTELLEAFKTTCYCSVSAPIVLQHHMKVGRATAERLYLDLIKRGWRFSYGKEEK